MFGGAGLGPNLGSMTSHEPSFLGAQGFTPAVEAALISSVVGIRLTQVVRHASRFVGRLPRAAPDALVRPSATEPGAPRGREGAAALLFAQHRAPELSGYPPRRLFASDAPYLTPT